MSTQEMALSKIDVENYTFVHADDATVVIDNCRAPKPMVKRAREEAYTFVHANDATAVTNNCGAPLQKKKKASSTKNQDSLCATPPEFEGIDNCRDDEEENVDEIKQEDNFNLMKGRVRRYGAGLVSGMVGFYFSPVLGLAAGLGLAYAISQKRPLDSALMTSNISGSRLNAEWQSDKDMQYRREMIQHM
jgi:hypothetical protein